MSRQPPPAVPRAQLEAFRGRASCVAGTLALPTGEHCPKGLICLGCAHAQPKKSAVPIFRRMLASHGRSLAAARGHSEPGGQIAAREMEIVRIKGALQRAEDLSDDVAAAIERAL
jgi:hypothetical protein